MDNKEIILKLTRENQELKNKLEECEIKLKETPKQIAKKINYYLLHNKPDEKSYKEFVEILKLTKIPMNTFSYEELHEGYLGGSEE